MAEADTKPELEPDLTTPLADTPLIPEPAFHDKLRAIFGPGGVSKDEVERHMRENPDPPQKRGRKAKENQNG